MTTTSHTLTDDEERKLRITISTLRRNTAEVTVQMYRETAIKRVERRAAQQRTKLADLEARAAAAGLTDI